MTLHVDGEQRRALRLGLKIVLFTLMEIQLYGAHCCRRYRGVCLSSLFKSAAYHRDQAPATNKYIRHETTVINAW